MEQLSCHFTPDEISQYQCQALLTKRVKSLRASKIERSLCFEEMILHNDNLILTYTNKSNQCHNCFNMLPPSNVYYEIYRGKDSYA